MEITQYEINTVIKDTLALEVLRRPGTMKQGVAITENRCEVQTGSKKKQNAQSQKLL